MKFSYLGSTETMLPGRPGGTYFISWLLQGSVRISKASCRYGAGLAADSRCLPYAMLEMKN
jgi:hypothetical protein